MQVRAGGSEARSPSASSPAWGQLDWGGWEMASWSPGHPCPGKTSPGESCCPCPGDLRSWYQLSPGCLRLLSEVGLPSEHPPPHGQCHDELCLLSGLAWKLRDGARVGERWSPRHTCRTLPAGGPCAHTHRAVHTFTAGNMLTHVNTACASVYMHTCCADTLMHVHTHSCTHAGAHTLMKSPHVHECSYLCTHVYVHTAVPALMHLQSHETCKQLHALSHICTFIPVHAHTCTHKCT